jgi:hypothetical protein
MAALSPQKLGSVIAAAFGSVFVLANTASFPTVIAGLLRVLAAGCVVVVLLAVRRPERSTHRDPPTGVRGDDDVAVRGYHPSAAVRPAASAFGRGYWLIAAAEVAAVVLGLGVLNGPLATPHAAVAWISCVVGVHFFALAVIWKQSPFHWLGGGLLCCGVLGLVLATADSRPAAVDLVAGVIPGALLLGFGLWVSGGVPRSRRTSPSSNQ